MSPVEVPGSSVSLRDWHLEDLNAYARWLAPGHRWQQLDGPYYAKPSEKQVSQIINRKRRTIEAGDLPTPRENLTIALHEGGELLGMVTRAWESRETNWLTVGIVVFDSAWWGQGIGYEGLGLWSQHLFDGMPELARLDLRTWSGNAGMMRLALKLGYSEEARFRKARIVDGQYYNGLGYGVLREEWEELYPSGFVVRSG